MYIGACTHLFFADEYVDPQFTIHIPFEKGSLIGLKHVQLDSLDVYPSSPRILLFPPPQHALPCPCFLLFLIFSSFFLNVNSGDQTQVLSLASLTLEGCAILLTPFGVVTPLVYMIILQIKPLYCSVCSKSASESQIRHPPRFLWSR